MARRMKMSSGHSRKLFTRTAGHKHVHPKNTTRLPMRGGIRL